MRLFISRRKLNSILTSFVDVLHFSSFLCHELSEYCNDQKKKMSGSLTESSKPVSYDISSTSSSICEIEEEDSAELFEINHGMPPMAPIKEEIESSFFSFDVHGRENHHDQEEEDIVYVAVGKSDSSLEALSWTLNHAVNASTMIYLVHVFPEIKHIPSPLGKLPKSQVNPQQLGSFMAQERGKRRELLQKFLDACNNSKVKVETMLIESDMVAKAILDLIPVLNIRKLVIGTTKSSLRKLKSKRGSGIADQILQSAPETCEIKIVCEGKEVIDQMINDSPSPHSNDHSSPKFKPQEDENNDSVSCMCFKI
ncbi:U-box domain-containing protein 35 [Melia azedarach]|uniref:U-box domain-containing protein 35 n=1 Tax=Melia azedarach TaxID=155640 RepID=A0ACC1X0A4_MELAZ|nr:U-box domain-containing protein 35 [Melia azedarach]